MLPKSRRYFTIARPTPWLLPGNQYILHVVWTVGGLQVTVGANQCGQLSSHMEGGTKVSLVRL